MSRDRPLFFNVDKYLSNVIKKVSRKSADKQIELEKMLSYGRELEEREKSITEREKDIPLKLKRKKQKKVKKEKKEKKQKKVKKEYVRKTNNPSPWITHVKNYQKKHNVSYKEAVKKAKATYTVKKKERQRELNTRQSPWITHVKKYQKEHNVSYKEAIKKAKASYVAPPPIKIKRDYKQKTKVSDKVPIYNLTDWNTHLKNVGKEYAPNSWFKPRDSVDTLRQKLYVYVSRLKGYLHRAKRGLKAHGDDIRRQSQELYDRYIGDYNKVVNWIKQGLVKNKNGKIRGWIVVKDETQIQEQKQEQEQEQEQEKIPKPKKPKPKKPKSKTDFKTEWIDNMNRNYEGKLNLKEEDIKDIIQDSDGNIMITLKYNLDILMYDDYDEDYTEDMIDALYLEKEDMGYTVELRQNTTNRQGEIESVNIDQFFIYT